MLFRSLDLLVVVVRAVMAGNRALPEAVVALRVEEPRLGPARLLEAVVHVGGDGKAVRALKQT